MIRSARPTALLGAAARAPVTAPRLADPLLQRGALSASRRAAAAPAAPFSVDASSLRGKHLDNMFLLSKGELRALLDISHGLKKKLKAAPDSYRPLVRSRPAAWRQLHACVCEPGPA